MVERGVRGGSVKSLGADRRVSDWESPEEGKKERLVSEAEGDDGGRVGIVWVRV